jgi:hypothetical protein
MLELYVREVRDIVLSHNCKEDRLIWGGKLCQEKTKSIMVRRCSLRKKGGGVWGETRGKCPKWIADADQYFHAHGVRVRTKPHYQHTLQNCLDTDIPQTLSWRRLVKRECDGGVQSRWIRAESTITPVPRHQGIRVSEDKTPRINTSFKRWRQMVRN